MGNIFGKKVLPAKSESVDSTTVQPPTSTNSAYASEDRNKDGRKKKRSKKRSLKKKRT